jgi:hypothetical protein
MMDEVRSNVPYLHYRMRSLHLTVSMSSTPEPQDATVDDLIEGQMI